MFDSRFGVVMSEDPLNVFKRLDSEFFRTIENARDFTFTDGVLSRKYKLLVAMALDASVGAVEGVRVLAQSAMEAGATKEEIAEDWEDLIVDETPEEEKEGFEAEV